MTRLNQITLSSNLIQKTFLEKKLLLGDGNEIKSDDDDDDDDDDDKILPSL